MAQHPHQPDHGRRHGEGQKVFERFHPRAGTGQDFYRGREDREEQIRPGETDGDGSEDGERLDGAKGERGTERGGEQDADAAPRLE
jgi:hypothetical protein